MLHTPKTTSMILLNYIFSEWKFDLTFAPDFNTLERGTEVRLALSIAMRDSVRHVVCGKL